MSERPVDGAAGVLRGLRAAAGLTQEELAARAGLSPNAVGALERGQRRRPYPHTVGASPTGSASAMLYAANDHDPAEERWREGLHVSVEGGDRLGEGYCRSGLGLARLVRGDHEAAAARFARPCRFWRGAGTRCPPWRECGSGRRPSCAATPSGPSGRSGKA